LDAVKILIVEDDRLQVSALERWLHMGGHEVCWAQSAGSALMVLVAELPVRPIQVAIVDVHLGPGMDGIDLCTAMRRHPDDRIKGCAVVLLSGDSESSVRRMADAKSRALLTTRAIMQKPLSLQKLEVLLQIIQEAS
jgi:CheY-like chemotaxis protein